MNANNQKRTIVKVVALESNGPYHEKQRQWKGIFWAIGLIILLSLSLLACKGPQEQPPVQSADTAGLAAFQAQKLADSLAAVNVPMDNQEQNLTGDQNEGSSAAANTGSDGSNEDNGYSKSDNDVAGNSVDDGSAGTVDESTGNEVSQTQEAPVQKKKKFSNAGKGALIGAGSGAVLGAVISKKNRGLGAVIGAAVGGGAGYGIGKHKDNKEKSESE